MSLRLLTFDFALYSTIPIFDLYAQDLHKDVSVREYHVSRYNIISIQHLHEWMYGHGQRHGTDCRRTIRSTTQLQHYAK
jgi:hypothetical protein